MAPERDLLDLCLPDATIRQLCSQSAPPKARRAAAEVSPEFRPVELS